MSEWNFLFTNEGKQRSSSEWQSVSRFIQDTFIVDEDDAKKAKRIIYVFGSDNFLRGKNNKILFIQEETS